LAAAAALILCAALAGCGGAAADSGDEPGPAAPPQASSTSRAEATPAGVGTLGGAPRSAAPTHFATVKPGAKLPTGAQCATWVRAYPLKENKGGNAGPNQRTGQHVGADIFSDNAQAMSRLGVRVDGQFTGTTEQILRWAACKWGVDEDVVRAQAAVESWWQQSTLGDWSTDPARCAPGHGIGVDGKPGQCPESFGILQDRHPYQKSAWPGVTTSTAMNADLAYSIWRSCFEGYEGWLNDEDRVGTYAAGDQWGCVGRWMSGRWHTAESEDYVRQVRDYLGQRVWTTPDFQEP
jgi:autotransporter family porin